MVEELSDEIRIEMEHRSLELLQVIAEDIVVVGGWAARALGGEKHIRHTHDVDGVATKEGMERAHEKLVDLGLTPKPTAWGYEYFKPLRFPDFATPLNLKVQLSLPRIYDVDEIHYFEFNLNRVQTLYVRAIDRKVEAKAVFPEREYLISNKLGLPALFRHKYDACVLLQDCDKDEVASIIKNNDAWSEFATKRIARIMMDLRDPGSTLYREVTKTVDVNSVYKDLEFLLEKMREKAKGVLNHAKRMAQFELERYGIPPPTKIVPEYLRGPLKLFTANVLSRVRDMRGEAYPELLRVQMREEYWRVHYHTWVLIERGYVIGRKALGPNNRWVLKLKITPSGEGALRRALK